MKTNLYDDPNVVLKKCDCGQSKTFIFNKNDDYFICRMCKERVYRDEKTKEKYEKLKELYDFRHHVKAAMKHLQMKEEIENEYNRIAI